MRLKNINRFENKILYKLVIFSFLLIGCDTNEDEIVIIPKGFTGAATVIFNQSDGEPVEYYNNKRVYNIPNNGILKTQFDVNDGWSNFPEFYYEKIRKENRLKHRLYKNLPLDTIVAYGSTTGSMKKNSDTNDQIKFVEFYIGNKGIIDKARQEFGKLDTLQFVD